MRTVLFPLLLVCACTAVTERTYEASIYGEEFIEEGIPAAIFSDDWSVTFDKFLVSVGDITVADQPLGEEDEPYRIFDLAQASDGAGFPILEGTIAAEDPGAAYVIGPSSGAVAGNASEEDVALMKDGGYSIYVQGAATRGGETLTFIWGFSTRTLYTYCALAGATDVQLTIHADHLFYDDLFAENPRVSFDLIAASDDGDGELTADDLRAVDITTEERYQVGHLTNITDLWSFVEQLTATLGHINGEGHCSAVRTD
ncbi:hypothetical protein SAMN02745121_03591 [Nannocystis exedens]|uniref:Uncharacterized protein n=1 Tax=Nannocystis exedens TaxID=54 RepID=A0A1I1Z282_9BACT|nr:hypothetical protein [Nannocystis exedens]PCC75200.1 hypothetical protein NAEX_08306 [Nannocystis exedens]SFE25797.1 hypothetical protein SAMN02745121_03591 [Nannocystis exedens]